MAELRGKVAIITGAARGQGAEEARRFATEGAMVVVADILPEGEDVAREIGDNALYHPLDVASDSSWGELTQIVQKRFGRIDILVNNAAYYRPGRIRQTDLDLWDAHYRVNQLGIFLGMRAVIDCMAASGGGSIINVSSNAALGGVPDMFAYTTTKWAVRGMTKMAAVEFAPLGIRVNTILPGLIETPMLKANSEERNEEFVRLIPLGRKGQPQEVAELALFLASDRASFISGAEITIDGAMAV